MILGACAHGIPILMITSLMTKISSYSSPARKSSEQAGAGADRRQYSGLFFLPLSRSLVLSQATKYEFIQLHISSFLTLANATPVFLTVF